MVSPGSGGVVTLDNRPVQVFRREDYSYLVVSASPVGDRPHAEVWVSPDSVMSRGEIAAELRRLADFVLKEGQ